MKKLLLAVLALALGASAGAQDAGIEFRPPSGGSVLGLPTLHASVRVEAADMLALFTTPAVIVEGVPGHTILPLKILAYHEAGTAYATATGVEVTYDTSGLAVGGVMSTSGTFSLAGEAYQHISNGPGGSGGFVYGGIVPDLHATVSRPIVFRATGANPTAGTFGFDIDVWYVVVPSPDVNMVNNARFTGAATGWTLGLGGGAPDWAYSANTVTHGNGGGAAALHPTVDLRVTAGHDYRVTFTVSGFSAGTVTASIGGATGTARAANGTFTETLTATTTADLALTPTTTFVGVIDNVFVVDTSAP